MSTAIRIQNLSKKYLLNVRAASQQQSYDTLRDTIADFSKSLLRPSSFFKNSSSREEFWALKDINLNIEAGDKVAIIGHNGAGKSTLLKILSRITEPTSGRIELKGRVSSLLEVGTGFHPELTGRENIFLNGSILGMSRSEVKRKFDEIVDFAGVEKFLDTPVKRYSSGMRMRLGFAVAAHLESEILVIDEVLAVGDAEFQKKCLGKMDEISKTGGRTILFVSHNMGAVQQLCNKGVLLSKGSVMVDGNVNDIISLYHSGKKNGLNQLTQMPRKIGNSKLIFSDIWFSDSEGCHVQEIPMGESVNVNIKIQAKNDIPDGEYLLDVGICNILNERISLLTSRHFPQLQLFPMKAGEEKIISYRINSFPLNMGDYIVQLFFSYRGDVCDYIDNASVLTVLPADYYKSGYTTPAEKNWKFLLNYQMELK